MALPAGPRNLQATVTQPPAHYPVIDMNQNTRAFIENPLRKYTPEALDVLVNNFVEDEGLQDLADSLRKGAQSGRDPFAPQVARDLDESELEALRDENRHPFRHPPKFWLTISLLCCGALLQGWSQVGINAANIAWPAEFGIDPTTEYGNWIFALVNSAVYFASALFGCWLSDPLNNIYGRRGCVLFAAVFSFASSLGAALTQNWWQLLLCRILLGLGMGVKASVIPIYSAEVSPASVRGSIVIGSWQICVALGIFLGWSANLAMYRTGSIAWRLQIGSAFIPSVPLFFIFYCPESPRYLIRKLEYRQAYQNLLLLRNTPLQASRDLMLISAQVRVEQDLFKASGATGRMYAKRFFQLFSEPRIRRATMGSAAVMLSQQLCGINCIIFYSTTLYVNANAQVFTSMFVSWGIGLVNFLFGLPGFYFIDRAGRRPLLLHLYPHLAWTTLAAAMSYYIPEDDIARPRVIIMWGFLFVAFYSPGQGPVPFLYSAESFPVTHREVGMSFAVAVNLFFAGILTLLFPRMDHAIGAVRSLATFAGLNLVAWVLIFFFTPETKEYTLEELDSVFGLPTRQFIRYKMGYISKIIKSRIFRQEVVFCDLYVDKRYA